MNQPGPPTLADLRDRIRRLEGGFGDARLRAREPFSRGTSRVLSADRGVVGIAATFQSCSDSSSLRSAEMPARCAPEPNDSQALRRHVPTGLAALDAALAGGGLPAAAVTALLATGEGPPEAAWTLAVVFAAAMLRAPAGPAGSGPGGGAAVLVDRAGELYPPALAGLGLPLERTLFVTPLHRPPGRARDSPWAFEEALRSTAVAVAVGELRWPDAAQVRRLELAAEAGGGVGLALASEREAGVLGRVPVVLRVRPRPGEVLGFTIEVVRTRGWFSEGRGVEVLIAQDLVSRAAGPADGQARPARRRAPA